MAGSAAGLVVGGLAQRGQAAAPMAKQQLRQGGGGSSRVIIDTDPGVDDALALLLAMRSPELKIEGITPVAGNVPLKLTLPNALRMVEVAGRAEIPVAAGGREPLVRRLVTAAFLTSRVWNGSIAMLATCWKRAISFSALVRATFTNNYQRLPPTW